MHTMSYNKEYLLFHPRFNLKAGWMRMDDTPSTCVVSDSTTPLNFNLKS